VTTLDGHVSIIRFLRGMFLVLGNTCRRLVLRDGEPCWPVRTFISFCRPRSVNRLVEFVDNLSNFRRRVVGASHHRSDIRYHQKLALRHCILWDGAGCGGYHHIVCEVQKRAVGFQGLLNFECLKVVESYIRRAPTILRSKARVRYKKKGGGRQGRMG